MRIREICFRDFRCFRGEHRISFVDPLTDEPRPITVLAGTNGSGKSTVLESIEAMLRLLGSPDSQPPALVQEARNTGSIQLTVHSQEASRPQSLTFSDRLGYVEEGPLLLPDLANILGPETQFMDAGNADLRGGWLYFPHDRRLGPYRPGSIEAPPQNRQWLFRATPHNQWQGSLEQLWVWQNYLDLEAYKQRQGGENLKPFVETVETVLGEERKISVERGRAWVSVPWTAGGQRPRVTLDQLPSGEQQCLLLFGELARQRRPGAVIAIDEPELSLHPTLQRLVVHQLMRIAREWDAQVILATHSLEILRAVHESERLLLDELAQPEPALVEVITDAALV